MTQYLVKFDATISFDRKCMIEASSQEEAEEKAKQLMGKEEYELYDTINPVMVPNLVRLGVYYAFDNLKLETAYVEEF